MTAETTPTRVEVALETSTRPASVAVRGRGRTLVRVLDAERAHASDLLPALDRLLDELGARPQDIDAVFVGTGPGSYTGLRVGIATALGLVRATGAGLVGVPSGECIAFAELAPGEEAVVLLDARQDELYFARYRRLDDEVETLRAPAVLTRAELADALPRDVRIFGDPTVAAAAGLVPSAVARLSTDVVASAEALLELGSLRLAARGPTAPHEVEPLYLRPFLVKARRR